MRLTVVNDYYVTCPSCKGSKLNSELPCKRCELIKNGDDMQFQTPVWVCAAMCDLVNTTPMTVLEPTPGMGNLIASIKNKFPKSRVYAPVVFEDCVKDRFDLIIANPPFTPMTRGYELLDLFFGMSDNIIILMPWLAVINSEKRTEKYMANGLKMIVHLPRRAFPGSRVQTCILVFEKGYVGDVIFKNGIS